MKKIVAGILALGLIVGIYFGSKEVLNKQEINNATDSQIMSCPGGGGGGIGGNCTG